MAVILQRRQTLLCVHLAPFFSTWYSPPVFPVDEQDPVLSAISRAIKDAPHVPFESSLKKFLPSLTPYHVSSLIIRNPYSLSPASVLSFFKWVSSQNGFRLTLRTYCTMACFLCSHRMISEAQSLLQFVVSRKGKDSAPSVFAAILEAKGNQQPSLIFNALMNAYTDSGYVSDAIQCFRLVRKHGYRIPYNSCSHLLDWMMKSNSPSAAWAFFSEILKCGFPPNVYTFNILMHSFCKEGKLKEARVILDEIRRRGMEPTVVSFNTLIHTALPETVKKLLEEDV
ncbi:hypothetical protein H6P81_015829 [Aristolochia fimbriata]|uniref:Pentatricopeptide repeat-containing protein n=1 Tax=Aristolochia fimbriata TaxID=158543 RepID=A0AAV7E8E2_ARIFI|nr:hypothetical protein H6P81_015829 [Aristolochia fimbriata]